jgi:YD repeat-containing protein
MKIIFFFFLLSLYGSAGAQYYYNDIIGTQETNRQMKAYLANKVRTVYATGYDQRNVKASDFMEFHEVKENGRALKITSHTNASHTIYYSRFDEQGRLVSITDSSSAVQNNTFYEYDGNGRIREVQNITRDSANDFNQTETHHWLYTNEGRPEKMWRIINNDSLEIRFSPDEAGNAGDERTFRNGIETGAVYYYYDDKKRLTDIVRYNTRLKKLMPDLLFEYDDTDRIIQKITTTTSISLGYLIWRYIFDEKGLKTKEALFNDDKQLTGKIEYAYTFGQ